MKLCTIFCLEPLLSEEYHWRRRLTSINRPMTIATHWQNTTVGLLAVAALWWQIRSLPSPYSHVPKQHVGADVCVIMCWLWPITARRRILGYGKVLRTKRLGPKALVFCYSSNFYNIYAWIVGPILPSQWDHKFQRSNSPLSKGRSPRAQNLQKVYFQAS